jgi:hypothetical protein
MKTFKNVSRLVLFALISLTLVFVIALVFRLMSVEKGSKTIKSAHFDVIYSGILRAEAENISKVLEQNYERVRQDLADPKHDKITVFIHSNQDEFNLATGLVNSKANGTSRGPVVFHLKYETWFNAIFPPEMEKVAVHEFTHCVQLNVLIQDALSRTKAVDSTDFDKNFEMKFEKEYPQWFWEALCDFEAGMVNAASVKYGMSGNPTLKELNNSHQIYNVGHSIIAYFVSKYGKEKLPDFMKSYGNFEQTLGITEKEFESGWYKFVSENYR